MSLRLEIFEKVAEDELIVTFKELGDDDAKIITAINDNSGTFTVEATFIQPDAPAGSIVFDGKMSTFGGPADQGVKADEGLALFEQDDVPDNPDLFLLQQPPGTTGLARRLNPEAKYLACRWNYGITPKSFLKLKTTLVTITNPANNKAEKARPADAGPAVETGRVVDLSPSLAAALGLDTDQTCHVEIPTPADAQTPPAASSVATGINLQALDKTLFPQQDLTRSLVVATTANDQTYWVVNVVGTNIGGQSLLRHVDNKTDLLLSDTTVFPVEASAQIPAAIAGELNKAAPAAVPPSNEPNGNPPKPGDDINAKEFAAAQKFLGHDTSGVPGTSRGALACAWAVNQVTRLALGKPISTFEGGGNGNGLGTDGIFAALSAHHTKLNSVNDAKAGTIIIAPSTTKTHGHVGIVGAIAGNIRDTKVLSNRSHPGVFADRFTIGTFTDTYTGMGLQVLFFALNKDQF